MTGRRSHLMRFAAPAVLLLLVGASTVTVAQAASVPAPDLAPLVEAQVDGLDGAEPLLATGPTPDPATSVPKIEVVFPPPPPPPAPVSTGTRRGTSSGGGSSSGGGGGASSSSVADYCASGPAAITSASSLQGLLAAANTERAAWGLSALSWSNSLASSAQAWADYMAANSYFDHGGGGYSRQNIAKVWYTNGSVVAQSTAVANSHAMWMKSNGHCNTVLNSGLSSVGFGIASADGGVTWYVAANFS